MKKREKRRKQRKGQREDLLPITIFRPCIICGSLTANSGTFIPDDQAAYGAIPEKIRTFAYALCDECMTKRPRILTEIEQKIEAQWRAAFTRKVWHLDKEDGILKRTIYIHAPKPGMN